MLRINTDGLRERVTKRLDQASLSEHAMDASLLGLERLATALEFLAVKRADDLNGLREELAPIEELNLVREIVSDETARMLAYCLSPETQKKIAHY